MSMHVDIAHYGQVEWVVQHFNVGIVNHKKIIINIKKVY